MEQIIKELLIKVKQNKKYSTIADDIVLGEIKDYLGKKKLEKITKQDVKDIRKNLHRLYSSYLSGKKSKRKKLLEELKKSQENNQIINKMLSSSVSSKERLGHYEIIYNKIFQITGKPKTLVDIGCGLNPLSFVYMNIDNLNYYAYDIDTDDINFLNDFFKIIKDKINGKAQILNARNFDEIKNLPNSDLIFLWKLIDLINTKDSKPGEELIKILMQKTKYIVASFATRTISGKPMNFSRRKGFEIMLERIGFRFKSFNIPNEVFYILSK